MGEPTLPLSPLSPYGPAPLPGCKVSRSMRRLGEFAFQDLVDEICDQDHTLKVIALVQFLELLCGHVVPQFFVVWGQPVEF